MNPQGMVFGLEPPNSLWLCYTQGKAIALKLLRHKEGEPDSGVQLGPALRYKFCLRVTKSVAQTTPVVLKRILSELFFIIFYFC